MMLTVLMMVMLTMQLVQSVHQSEIDPALLHQIMFQIKQNDQSREFWTWEKTIIGVCACVLILWGLKQIAHIYRLFAGNHHVQMPGLAQIAILAFLLTVTNGLNVTSTISAPKLISNTTNCTNEYHRIDLFLQVFENFTDYALDHGVNSINCVDKKKQIKVSFNLDEISNPKQLVVKGWVDRGEITMDLVIENNLARKNIVCTPTLFLNVLEKHLRNRIRCLARGATKSVADVLKISGKHHVHDEEEQTPKKKPLPLYLKASLKEADKITDGGRDGKVVCHQDGDKEKSCYFSISFKNKEETTQSYETLSLKVRHFIETDYNPEHNHTALILAADEQSFSGLYITKGSVREGAVIKISDDGFYGKQGYLEASDHYTTFIRGYCTRPQVDPAGGSWSFTTSIKIVKMIPFLTTKFLDKCNISRMDNQIRLHNTQEKLGLDGCTLLCPAAISTNFTGTVQFEVCNVDSYYCSLVHAFLSNLLWMKISFFIFILLTVPSVLKIAFGTLLSIKNVLLFSRSSGRINLKKFLNKKKDDELVRNIKFLTKKELTDYLLIDKFWNDISSFVKFRWYLKFYAYPIWTALQWICLPFALMAFILTTPLRVLGVRNTVIILFPLTVHLQGAVCHDVCTYPYHVIDCNIPGGIPFTVGVSEGYNFTDRFPLEGSRKLLSRNSDPKTCTKKNGIRASLAGKDVFEAALTSVNYLTTSCTGRGCKQLYSYESTMPLSVCSTTKIQDVDSTVYVKVMSISDIMAQEEPKISRSYDKDVFQKKMDIKQHTCGQDVERSNKEGCRFGCWSDGYGSETWNKYQDETFVSATPFTAVVLDSITVPERAKYFYTGYEARCGNYKCRDIAHWDGTACDIQIFEYLIPNSEEWAVVVMKLQREKLQVKLQITDTQQGESQTVSLDQVFSTYTVFEKKFTFAMLTPKDKDYETTIVFIIDKVTTAKNSVIRDYWVVGDGGKYIKDVFGGHCISSFPVDGFPQGCSFQQPLVTVDNAATARELLNSRYVRVSSGDPRGYAIKVTDVIQKNVYVNNKHSEIFEKFSKFVNTSIRTIDFAFHVQMLMSAHGYIRTTYTSQTPVKESLVEKIEMTEIKIKSCTGKLDRIGGVKVTVDKPEDAPDVLIYDCLEPHILTNLSCGDIYLVDDINQIVITARTHSQKFCLVQKFPPSGGQICFDCSLDSGYNPEVNIPVDLRVGDIPGDCDGWTCMFVDAWSNISGGFEDFLNIFHFFKTAWISALFVILIVVLFVFVYFVFPYITSRIFTQKVGQKTLRQIQNKIEGI